MTALRLGQVSAWLGKTSKSRLILVRLFRKLTLSTRSTFPPLLPTQPPIMPRYHRWLGGEEGREGGAEKPQLRF
ncbi:MAG: hypothetical protein IIB35_11235 [Gemmatimonadetes bacterium]|nr:hypothetical protein [Gemmatimonadota bacterium]